MHPSLLHNFFVYLAPCLMHTPPLITTFVHPSLLHCLTFAPCLTQTPPLTTMFVHPSAEHIYLYCFRANFLAACSSFLDDGFRFLFELPFLCVVFTAAD